MAVWDVTGALAMSAFWALGAVAVLHPSTTLARVRAGLVLLYLLVLTRRIKEAEDDRR